MPRRSPALVPVLAVALLLSACAATAPDAGSTSGNGSTPTASPAESAVDLSALEAEHDATIGLYAVDTGTGRAVAYRADERFPYTSTFKVLLASAVLDSADDGDLDELVPIAADDIVDYSPVTENHVGDGMTLADLIQATLSRSDNTAANLMFDRIGGPPALQEWLAGIGDTTTKVSRLEPDLNEALPGDERDTSTPRVLADDLQQLALGTVLTDEDRTRLLDGMADTTGGTSLIAAGVPAGWVVHHKAGAGAYGVLDDIAVVLPPDGDPIVIAVMSRRTAEDDPFVEQIATDAARVAVASLTGTSAAPTE